MCKLSQDALKELGWLEMEKVQAFPVLTDGNAEPRLYIPGGGITKGLYKDRYETSISYLTEIERLSFLPF